MKEYIDNPDKFTTELKALLIDGEVNPIKVKILFDGFKKIMEDNFTKGLIMDEADKHEKIFEVAGMKFTKSSKTSWSFKHATIWKDVDDEQKRIEGLMKEAYSKNVNSEENSEYSADNVGDVCDPETGEVVPPAHKTNSEFIKRTI